MKRLVCFTSHICLDYLRLDNLSNMSISVLPESRFHAYSWIKTEVVGQGEGPKQGLKVDAVWGYRERDLAQTIYWWACTDGVNRLQHQDLFAYLP